MSQCQFHGYDSLDCPECRKEELERVRQGIADETLVFGAFVWRGDARYKLEDAIRVFKRKAAAEKYAAANELVVRTVSK